MTEANLIMARQAAQAAQQKVEELEQAEREQQQVEQRARTQARNQVARKRHNEMPRRFGRPKRKARQKLMDALVSGEGDIQKLFVRYTQAWVAHQEEQVATANAEERRIRKAREKWENILTPLIRELRALSGKQLTQKVGTGTWDPWAGKSLPNTEENQTVADRIAEINETINGYREQVGMTERRTPEDLRPEVIDDYQPKYRFVSRTLREQPETLATLQAAALKQIVEQAQNQWRAERTNEYKTAEALAVKALNT